MAVDRAENKATDIGFMASVPSLGGVHVDVYCIRWHAEKEKGRRVASFLNDRGGVKYSVAEQAAIDWAAIDERDQLAASRATNARFGGQSTKF